jgi:hypothetical protein
MDAYAEVSCTKPDNPLTVESKRARESPLV